MKRCPTCNKTYTDQNLSFCIDDGTPLIRDAAEEQDAGVPRPGATPGPPSYSDTAWRQPPGYKAPENYSPPGGGQNRRVWPWVVGIVAVLGLGIVAISIS